MFIKQQFTDVEENLIHHKLLFLFLDYVNKLEEKYYDKK